MSRTRPLDAGPSFHALDELLLNLLPSTNATWDWFGHRIGELRSEVEQLIDERVKSNWIISELSSALYRDFYTLGRPLPPESSVATGLPISQGFIEELTRLDHVGIEVPVRPLGSSSELARLGEDGPVVRIRRHPEGPRLEVRDGVHFLRLPSVSSQRQPGFIYFLNPKRLTSSDSGNQTLSRIYINHRLEETRTLVRYLLDVRDRMEGCCSFKVLVSVDARRRSDSCVLYMSSSRAENLGNELVSELGKRVHLGDETPVFTRKLGRGIGYAEDPVSGESFGEVRCRKLAHAIYEVDHVDSKGLNQDERLARVVDQMEAVGIDWMQPWREPEQRLGHDGG